MDVAHRTAILTDVAKNDDPAGVAF